MWSAHLKRGFVLFGLVSFCTYLYLNTGKLTHAYSLLLAATSGTPADYLHIEGVGPGTIEVPLPSSDLFEKDTQRQINFYRLPSEKLDHLQQNPAAGNYAFNGAPISPGVESKDGYLRIDLPGRLLYLLAANDLPTFAEIAHRHSASKPSLTQCSGPACNKLMVQITAGAAPLQGPYLSSDPDIFKRSLPLGRWINSNRLDLWIGSREAAQARMTLKLLGLQSDIPTKPQGPVASVRMEMKQAVVKGNGLGALHACELHLDLILIKGSNNLSILFETPLKTRVESEGTPVDILLAAYLTGITLDTSDSKP